MLQSIKYEIKSSYSFFLTILLGMVFANLLLYPIINRVSQSSNTGFIFGLLVFILTLVLIGCSIVFLFMLISSFRKEFYTDKGYFTFSRPISSSQFLGSKLTVSVIWTLIYTFSFVIINIIGLRIMLGGSDFSQMISMGTNILDQVFDKTPVMMTIISLLYSFFQLVLAFLIMYLSIVISKILFQKNTLGYIWFLFFIVINYIINLMSMAIYHFFPYYLTTKGIQYLPMGVSSNAFELAISNSSVNANMNSGIVDLVISQNIGELIALPILVILIFVLTSYLIKKKVEI